MRELRPCALRQPHSPRRFIIGAGGQARSRLPKPLCATYNASVFAATVFAATVFAATVFAAGRRPAPYVPYRRRFELSLRAALADPTVRGRLYLAPEEEPLVNLPTDCTPSISTARITG